MSADVLYVVVRLGADRYAIEAAQVVEVIPLVRLKALYGAPPGVAGVMNYRGEPIPVIDLDLVATGSSTKPLNGARILIVDLAVVGNRRGNVGLLVPQATETLLIDPGSFASSGVSANGAPYLGPVLTTDAGVIQRVSVPALLTPDLLAALFPAVGAA